MHMSTNLTRPMSVELAEENMASVRRMLAGLAAAARSEGRTHAEIAGLMGVDEETVDAALTGRLDLTLSDLQELALAIGAYIGYQVHGGVDRELDAWSNKTADAAMHSWLDDKFDETKIVAKEIRDFTAHSAKVHV